MRTFFRRVKSRDSGQGLVEFALVLPILLLVTFGVIETGRFFFTYTCIFAASREAARYASAAGNSGAGVPYYLDCNGIATAASRIGSLAGASVSCSPLFTDVQYDRGPGQEEFEPNVAADVELGDRVKVRVHVNYTPIFALIAPDGFEIASTTSRTILKEVPVYAED